MGVRAVVLVNSRLVGGGEGLGWGCGRMGLVGFGQAK